MTDPDGPLVAQLARAQTVGLLGPGPVEDHLAHAQGFLAAVAAVDGRIVDLGSGAGIPGLVLAVRRPDLDVVLLDARAKRCQFLREAVQALGLTRTSVVEGRAEVVGRGPLRGTVQAVVARSFGPPAATAECAAPLLSVGGLLVVSEPPEGADRWPEAGIGLLGLERGPTSSGSPRIQTLVQRHPCPDRFPRRDGVPAKQPLF